MKERSEEDKHLEAEFYAKKFYLSYSGLSKLMTSPTEFYRHYILNQRDNLDSEGINMGKAIHCLLLDREMFDNQFVVSSSNIPTENTKVIVDRVYAQVQETPGILDDYQIEILGFLTEINLHQSLKTDAQRIDKIINQQSKDYFEYLKLAKGKTIIDLETYDNCILAVESIESNDHLNSLLGLNESNPENVIYNEYMLKIEADDYPFGLHGILDNIKVEKATKTIYINDLKRTGKSLVHFEESVEKYNYGIQAAMYMTLVKENFKEIITDGWDVRFNFIVVDKFNQSYAFGVSHRTMKDWTCLLEEKLKEVKYHYLNHDYQLPYAFAIGKVTL